MDSIVEKLRVKAQATPPGTWVEGYFFDDTKVITDRARAAFNRVGNEKTFTGEQKLQRGRDGLAHISKQFARRSRALQAVRARGDLKHRVSYEAGGKLLDSMIASGIETGFGDEWIRLGATSDTGGWIVLGAHNGPQHSVSRSSAALQGQRHRDAG